MQGFVNPHGLRITFLPPPPDPNVNAAQINNMFSISALFFKQLLQVTDVADSTRYNGTTSSCGFITPTSIPYSTTGFDFATSDMIVSTNVEYNMGATYIAYAAPCIIRTWVQYGYIGFNTFYFKTDPTLTAQFQSNLHVLVFFLFNIVTLSNSYFGNESIFMEQ